jgi:hypothetical protein
MSYKEWQAKFLHAVTSTTVGKEQNALGTVASFFTDDYPSSFKQVKYDTSQIQAALRDSR